MREMARESSGGGVCEGGIFINLGYAAHLMVLILSQRKLSHTVLLWTSL